MVASRWRQTFEFRTFMLVRCITYLHMARCDLTSACVLPAGQSEQGLQPWPGRAQWRPLPPLSHSSHCAAMAWYRFASSIAVTPKRLLDLGGGAVNELSYQQASGAERRGGGPGQQNSGQGGVTRG